MLLPLLDREAIADVPKRLESDAFVMVTGVESVEVAAELGAQLGAVVTTRFGTPSYAIRPRNGGRGSVDADGLLVLSTTDLPQDMHTDGFQSEVAPRYLILLRTDDAEDFTESTLADTTKAFALLDPDMVEQLRKPIFPAVDGPRALLTSDPYRFRYSRHHMRRVAQEERAVAGLLDQVDAALAAVTVTTHISSHACLVIDNWRATHGRGALTTSERVVERIWVDEHPA